LKRTTRTSKLSWRRVKKTASKPANATNASAGKSKGESQESTPIELNSAFTVADFAEVTLTGTAFTTKVEPPKKGSGLYSYYEVKDKENIYLDTTVSVKSLLTSGKSSKEFAEVKVKYDGKYDYKTFSTIEEQGGTDFTYTNITSIEPLKTGVLHFIAELPKDAAADGKPIEITIVINGKNYVHKLR
jgi:hypothetical protein